MSKGKQSERRIAELNKKNLTRADLTRQDLGGANLIRANMRGANLSNADLVSANLCEANLIDANFSGANLVDASLLRAKLNGADFTKADDVTGADFRNTNISMAKGLTMHQIRSARIDETTKIPRAFKEKMPNTGS